MTYIDPKVGGYLCKYQISVYHNLLSFYKYYTSTILQIFTFLSERFTRTLQTNPISIREYTCASLHYFIPSSFIAVSYTLQASPAISDLRTILGARPRNSPLGPEAASTAAAAAVADTGAALAVVLQKVASELHPKVRNHGEGPY